MRNPFGLQQFHTDESGAAIKVSEAAEHRSWSYNIVNGSLEFGACRRVMTKYKQIERRKCTMRKRARELVAKVKAESKFQPRSCFPCIKSDSVNKNKQKISVEKEYHGRPLQLPRREFALMSPNVYPSYLDIYSKLFLAFYAVFLAKIILGLPENTLLHTAFAVII